MNRIVNTTPYGDTTPMTPWVGTMNPFQPAAFNSGKPPGPGYTAPPLDGVWATAPFFHNGSVPTLDGVLNPALRPATWTSNMSADDYDLEHVGWINKPFDGELTLDGNFGTFNTTQPGNSNAGHTYAAELTEAEQRALLEYLKTL
jgi:cytochrome c peroxidase